MPKNKKTDRFYKTIAEHQDRRDAEQFGAELAEEGIHADVRPHNERFLALVISQEEHKRLVALENEEMHRNHTMTAPDEPRYSDVDYLSSDNFLKHPDIVSGNTPMEALTKGYAAYLGRAALHDQDG